MNLYEINAEILMLLDQVDPETGELADDIADRLTDLNMNLTEKLDNTAAYIKSRKAESAAIKAEMDELTKRKKSIDAHASRLEAYIADAMVMSEQKKLETSRVKINLRMPQSVNITDFDILPDCFKRTKTTVEADKVKIANELKTGSRIDGAELVTKPSVTIK